MQRLHAPGAASTSGRPAIQAPSNRLHAAPRVIAPVGRRVVAHANEDGSNKIDADSLAERIASGQYTDSGSTKEKITRPLRQALAKDPLGLGEMRRRVRVCRRSQG